MNEIKALELSIQALPLEIEIDISRLPNQDDMSEVFTSLRSQILYNSRLESDEEVKAEDVHINVVSRKENSVVIALSI